MIVWSGWGFLVAVFYVVGYLIGIPVGGLVSTDPDIAAAVAFVVAGLLAGLGSFLLARQIEKGEGRAFIDEATQQRIVVRKSAGSLFFIPTRYWAYISPVVGIGIAVLMMTAPPAGPVAPAAPVSEAPAAAQTT
ncbi:hypothetical protein GGQ87_002707 [Brevundimonas alba]|uniref:Uncharacterized protein n=1 Tax=Brevundimonas alba TaxID=74314 RepID=A0A7X6BPF7_9CAUL|nr:hypothetical protein [Brevundimonas alba]NJC42412.1 hypothetical protein [Brevundimonas alba]